MLNFAPFITDHDLNNALALARAAKLAYEDESRIKATTEEWGLTRCQFLSEEETQLFVAADEDLVIVAFRGTEEKIQDFVTDVRFGLVDGLMEGRVHRGFRDALRHVWTDVPRAVSEFQNNHQSLWVTGHSLGAALATLATAEWIEEDKPINGLYTFGSPRVGDKRFARHFNSEAKVKTFRYVNNQDIVTRVSPRVLDYRHVGTMKYFGAKGHLHDDPSVWNQFLDSVKVVFEDFGELPKESFRDHGMENYVELTRRGRRGPETDR